MASRRFAPGTVTGVAQAGGRAKAVVAVGVSPGGDPSAATLDLGALSGLGRKRVDLIDAPSRELLGDTPQAFSHVGLIIAAHALDNAAWGLRQDFENPIAASRVSADMICLPDRRVLIVATLRLMACG